MARENQGLQIALIALVTLLLLLGGTTYVFYHSYDEASKKVVSLQAESSKNLSLANAAAG